VIYANLVLFGNPGKYEDGVSYGIDVIYEIGALLELDVVFARYDLRFQIGRIALAVFGRNSLVSACVPLTAYYVIYGDYT
jgi:hypothetical protein